MAFQSELGISSAVLGKNLVAGTPIESVSPTSVLGSDESIAGSLLIFGFGADAVAEIILTASNTLNLTQQGDVEKEKLRTGTSTLSLTQQADRAGVFSTSANNTLSLTHSHILSGPQAVTASNSLSLTQSAAPGLLTRDASNTLTFTQIGNVGGEKEVSAQNSILFTQTALSGLVTRTGANSLSLEQESNAFTTNPAVGIDRTASSSIAFAQTNNRFILKAGAIGLTASNLLAFTQRAIFPIVLTADNTISFTHVANADALSKDGTQEITFAQSAYRNLVRSLTASSTFAVSHGFTYLQLRDGIPVVGDSDGCNITRQYAPLSGGGGTPDVRPVPPTLTKFDDVVFYYPVGTQCAATESMTLRTPNFGDRDRNLYTRIKRESRGGSLRVFRDPQWPAERSLVMDFSGITQAEVDNILSFLQTTLGQKVSFRDWQGRVWSGIITTPDAQITFSGRENFDIAIEMEVDEDELQAAVCSQLTFTQSASVVKV